jgi:hypothetical protein
MVAGRGRGFSVQKTLLSSALSQVRVQISTHSDGNFGLSNMPGELRRWQGRINGFTGVT